MVLCYIHFHSFPFESKKPLDARGAAASLRILETVWLMFLIILVIFYALHYFFTSLEPPKMQF